MRGRWASLQSGKALRQKPGASTTREAPAPPSRDKPFTFMISPAVRTTSSLNIPSLSCPLEAAVFALSRWPLPPVCFSHFEAYFAFFPASAVLAVVTLAGVPAFANRRNSTRVPRRFPQSPDDARIMMRDGGFEQPPSFR
jgi:hypothetical protein